MTARIDPPTTAPGSSRCVHDMLDGTCSICRGLPDVPELSPWDAHVVVDADPLPPIAGLRTFYTEKGGACVRCEVRFGVGALVAWSPDDGGVVGQCCADEL